MSTLPPPPSGAAGEDPVLAALCAAACTATGASSGWVVAIDGDRLRVVAARGPLGARVRGLVLDVSGTAGYVAASGQPMAVTPRAGDANLTGGVLGAVRLTPSSLLAVPCHDDSEVVGVIELVDKDGGARFSFDDVELATLLAGVAGPAVTRAGGVPAAPSPDVLATQLRALADVEPARYAQVALVVQQLLASA